MTSMAEAATSDRITALCCECGASRTVSRRFAPRGCNCSLRCADCGRATLHAAVSWRDDDDWREDSNRKGAGELAKITRDVAHIRSLGILVDYGRPQGGKCMISHYLEPDEDGPEWLITVQEDLPVDVLRRVVTWAWRVMLPSYVKDYDKSWNGEVSRDEYGESRGCYYTGD